MNFTWYPSFDRNHAKRPAEKNKDNFSVIFLLKNFPVIFSDILALKKKSCSGFNETAIIVQFLRTGKLFIFYQQV